MYDDLIFGHYQIYNHVWHHRSHAHRPHLLACTCAEITCYISAKPAGGNLCPQIHLLKNPPHTHTLCGCAPLIGGVEVVVYKGQFSEPISCQEACRSCKWLQPSFPSVCTSVHLHTPPPASGVLIKSDYLSSSTFGTISEWWGPTSLKKL